MDEKEKIIKIKKDFSFPSIGIREIIEIEVSKENRIRGGRFVRMKFSARDKKGNSRFSGVFYRVCDGSYSVRKVIRGVYEEVNEVNETNEATFSCRNERKVKEIIDQIIQERKKYLAHRWFGKKVYIIYL